MPDPQQCGHSRQPSNGLDALRAISKRLVRRRRTTSNNSDSSSSRSSGNRSKNSQDCARNERVDSSPSSDDGKEEMFEGSSKKWTTDNSDSGSCKTSDSEVVALLTKVMQRLSTAVSAKPEKDTKPEKKSILRQPTYYVYQRGISGLPTQRVRVSKSYYRYPHGYHRWNIQPRRQLEES